MSFREPDVWVGLDIGKESHHAQIINASGVAIESRPVRNEERAIESLLDAAAARGSAALVIDLECSLAQLVLAVACRRGVPVAYIPGLMMRRAAELFPGEAKTDPRDSYVLAETARLHQQRLRWLELSDERMESLAVLCGHDDDIVQDQTRAKNRLRDCLVAVSPALERVLGPRLDHPAVVGLLGRFPTPSALRSEGRDQIVGIVKPLAPRMGERLVDDIMNALDAQTVTLAGEAARGEVIVELARDLQRLSERRSGLEGRIRDLFRSLPGADIVTSMTGVGERTGVRILLEIRDIARFRTAAHLASFSGIAPVTRRSGTSIRGERRSQRGNRRLQQALWQSAFCALRSDPHTRAYYDRKRAEGKTHAAALTACCRRRVDVLHAMLRTGQMYQADHRETRNAA